MPIGVLIPVGSTEQHGSHLPADVDTRVATEVATRVAKELGSSHPEVSWQVAPAIAYGDSNEHAHFSGTLSITTPALVGVLTSLADSVAEAGQMVVFVNAHGGNVPALRQAGSWWRGNKMPAFWVPCVPGAPLEGEPPHDAHAGHTETSLMLFLDPGAVDMDKAVTGNTAPLSDLMPKMMVGGVSAVSPEGVLGNPLTANASLGERYLREMVEGVVRRIQHATPDATSCLSDPQPSGD
jgi:mycofactocin system creatininase family protein